MNERKGVSIVSEAIIIIGVIAVALIFVLLSTQMISSQAEGAISDIGERMIDDISAHIETMEGFKGVTTVEYQPQIGQYRLTVKENSRIELKLPGQNITTARFQNANISNTQFANADVMCIKSTERNVTISSGNCTSTDLANFCAGGRCKDGICQQEYGETCAVADCSCPDDVESGGPATETCQPGYTPGGYIGGSGEPTADIGCVTDEYVGAQGEGDQCQYNFECQGSMECNPTAGTASVDKACCPAGQGWDGTECVERQVLDVVYIPVHYDSMGAFQSDVDSNYDKFTSSSPVDTISVERYTPSSFSDSATCEALNNDGFNGCSLDPPGGSCWGLIKNCANDVFGNDDWDRVEAICGDPGQCNSENGISKDICGVAQNIPARAEVSHSPSAEPDCQSTSPHELGHTFGLEHITAPGCDVPAGACGGPNSDDCGDANGDSYHMSYCNLRSQYGPAARQHLEENSLSPYITD